MAGDSHTVEVGEGVAEGVKAGTGKSTVAAKGSNVGLAGEVWTAPGGGNGSGGDRDSNGTSSDGQMGAAGMKASEGGGAQGPHAGDAGQEGYWRMKGSGRSDETPSTGGAPAPSPPAN
ncbi:unnamed protein product, partial [Discosporangium mesarthrocarpum]